MLTTENDEQVYLKLNSISVEVDTASGVNTATVDYTITVEGVQEHGFYIGPYDPTGIGGPETVTLIEIARLQHVV